MIHFSHILAVNSTARSVIHMIIDSPNSEPPFGPNYSSELERFYRTVL